MGSSDPVSSKGDLDRRLKEARSKIEPKQARQSEPRNMAGVGVGLRIAVDLVAGVAVGVGIGWYLDSVLGSKPWLLLLFTILGFCAGLLNVVRTANQLEAARKRAEEEAARERENGT